MVINTLIFVQIIVAMKNLMAEEEFASVTMKPELERVQPGFGKSFHYQRFHDAAPNKTPVWHYHPEVELVYIAKGNGKRHIGNHISYYTSGDLLLIGPNVPHYGFTDRFSSANHENIVQFDPEIVLPALQKLPEMAALEGLLERSRHGLTFFGKTKKKVGALTDELVVLNDFDRLLVIFKILRLLADSEEYHTLNVQTPTVRTSLQDHVRIKVIVNHVIEHFQEDIPLEEISALINMTPPSFCRYFKKQTGKTFTQYVNEFRVTHACKLLSETSRQIADVCFDCGFNNFAHFNNQFKRITAQTPSQYRAAFRVLVTG